mmetsp:Transcript_7233/g.10349  ORF Transcript_7233/g.10349 Transcript_7233/m.10349 type:complete len:659 (-) Transcript_7233:313-2289(-)|eukprot:CAMPEP_0202458600 /NCGR_PEP_ID=MMETSP1360-20130828/26478_1 /ASSEMBLY_ACC=CAM_ASM_000848 /TAXON_ID=515479 /ORGANISM="Licmophora paradoxa, Strain CCMP2313" /LENGTH=658 /DNA_ID=CAMNT_0049079217 /DNA_START=99 /DNA_END=2075 /DNA_ORIENTATION=-
MSADLKSSPSSSKSSGESHSTTTPYYSSSTKRSSDITLRVRKQPPTYAFPDEWFELEFALDGPKNTTTTTKRDYNFTFSLLHAKTGKNITTATLEGDPPSITFSPQPTTPPSKRIQKLRCRIRIAHHIPKDRLESYFISLGPDPNNPSLAKVGPISTNSVILVNHKLKVITNDWEHVWYKDEGGREKSMNVTVSLFDRHDKLYKGEQIPLKMTLYYANENEPSMKVMKQEILRSVGTSKQCIDKITGKSTLRFRIDDVSKNHQGQDFRVHIAPSPKIKGYQDIAPGFTPSVSVRSKRNKRHRSQSSSSSRIEPRLSPAHRLDEGIETGPFATTDLPQLREAMKGVLQWTEEVISGLYPLQWQVIGYHPGPDGNPDYNRPYHNMPNPNPCISRVLGMYTDTTRDQLGLLAAAIDRSSNISDTAQYPMDPTGPPSIPRHGGLSSGVGVGDRYGMRGGPMPPLYPHSEPFQQEPYPPPQMMRHGIPPHSMQTMSMARGPPPRNEMPLYRPEHPSTQSAGHGVSRHRHSPLNHEKNRENEVSIILAKQYRSLRTGDRLGFPAYTEAKELIGFYRENSMKVGAGQFVPLSRHADEFGPMEMMQATEILEEAIRKKSEAVHSLKHWGSISRLLDHALVYEWSKDIGDGTSSRSSGSSAGMAAVE